jgi:phage shock protein A
MENGLKQQRTGELQSLTDGKKGKKDPKERSKTFPGIAQAMAEQYGPLLLEENYKKRSKGNMSTEISVNVRRAYIETNLEQCKKNIALSMWQIGNLLNQAKDEGVVPHGEWTAWATTHSGLNERGVQLAMRQARELAQDSPLLELDDSKINALIRIPAEEREAFAARIDAENATSREVTEAVAQYRRELDEVKKERNALIDKAAEKTKEVERLRGEVKRQTRAAESALREANVYKDSTEVLKKQNDTYATQVVELRQDLEAMTAPEIEELKKHIEELKDKLKAAENNTTLADSERAAYERRIEQLEDELDAADMRANVSTMRGGGQAVDPISTINAAIGAMIASAGGSVAALGAVQMDDGTRQMLMSHAVTLRTMSQAILDAIGG